MSQTKQLFWYSTDATNTGVALADDAMREIRSSWTTARNTTTIVGPAASIVYPFTQKFQTLILSTRFTTSKSGSLNINLRYSGVENNTVVIVQPSLLDDTKETETLIIVPRVPAQNSNDWRGVSVELLDNRHYNIFIVKTNAVPPAFKENVQLYTVWTDSTIFTPLHIGVFEEFVDASGNSNIKVKGLVVLPSVIPDTYGNGSLAYIPSITVDSYGRVTEAYQRPFTYPAPFKVTNYGYVGIGTALPLNKFHVNGIAQANEFYGAGSNITCLTSSNLVGQIPDSCISPLTLQSNVSTGTFAVGIGTTTPASELHVAGSIIATQDITVEQVTAMTGVDAQYLQVEGNTVLKKNLDVRGTITASNLNVINTMTTYSNTVQSTHRTVITSMGVGGDALVVRQNAQPNSDFHIANFIKKDGHSVLRITNQGNVGIGCTNLPQFKLDVNGTIRASSFVGNVAATGVVGVLPRGTIPAPITITANSNIGIGSTLPANALDVKGTVYATSIIGEGSRVTHLAASNLVGTIPRASLPHPITIDAGLKVGIGTEIPKASLDVNGSLLATDITIRTGGMIEGNGYGLTNIQAHRLVGRIYNTALPLEMQIASNTLTITCNVVVGTLMTACNVGMSNNMLVTGNVIVGGNIGIGTTIAPVQLSVASSITCENNSRVMTAGSLLREPVYYYKLYPYNEPSMTIEMEGGVTSNVLVYRDTTSNYSAYMKRFNNLSIKTPTTISLAPTAYIRKEFPVDVSTHAMVFLQSFMGCCQGVEAWICHPVNKIPIARLQASFDDYIPSKSFGISPFTHSRISQNCLVWTGFTVPLELIKKYKTSTSTLFIAFTSYYGSANPYLQLSGFAMCPNPYGITCISPRNLFGQVNGGYQRLNMGTEEQITNQRYPLHSVWTALLKPNYSYDIVLPIASYTDLYVMIDCGEPDVAIEDMVLMVVDTYGGYKPFYFNTKTVGRSATKQTTVGVLIPGAIVFNNRMYSLGDERFLRVLLQNNNQSASVNVYSITTECAFV